MHAWSIVEARCRIDRRCHNIAKHSYSAQNQYSVPKMVDSYQSQLPSLTPLPLLATTSTASTSHPSSSSQLPRFSLTSFLRPAPRSTLRDFLSSLTVALEPFWNRLSSGNRSFLPTMHSMSSRRLWLARWSRMDSSLGKVEYGGDGVRLAECVDSEGVWRSVVEFCGSGREM